MLSLIVEDAPLWRRHIAPGACPAYVTYMQGSIVESVTGYKMPSKFSARAQKEIIWGS